jgi:Rrf2 family transcriptional regulator, repressor of oqxAB
MDRQRGPRRTKCGKDGLKLGRRPDAITLKDNYLSVTEEKSLFTGRSDVPSICVVSRNITSFFGEVSAGVD